MNEFEKILSKALSNANYANTLRFDPEAAIKELGVVPTPENVKAVREAVAAMLHAETAFSGVTRAD
jgi:hypothetical protein